MGRFSGSDVAIDLGTANTCIHTRGTVALSLPVVKADQRLATVVIGAGRLQSDQALLSKATVN